MEISKKMIVTGVIIAVAVLVTNVSALVPSLSMLPNSTYAQETSEAGGGNWQGFKLDFNNLARIEFSVYDRANLQNTGEQDLVNSLDLDGQYVYAYQLWSYNNSENIGTFQVGIADGFGEIDLEGRTMDDTSWTAGEGDETNEI